MIDQETVNRAYPLPNPENMLEEDVTKITDSIEKIDLDVNDLYDTTTSISSDLTNTKAAIQSGASIQASSTGSGNAYEIILTPAPTALTNGLVVHMIAHVNNTGPATLDVNGLGSKIIKKVDGDDLKSSDIITGEACFLFYDGANFQLINPRADQEKIDIATSNLMIAFEELQENHGGFLAMEAGWSDSFTSANEQGSDEANSAGYQHDLANTLYKGIDPGTGLSHDQDFTNESNYETYSESLADVSISGDTVTINDSSDFGANVLYATITIGSNSAIIDTRTDDKNVDVITGHSLTGANVAATISYHVFSPGKLSLSGIPLVEVIDDNFNLHGTPGHSWAWGFATSGTADQGKPHIAGIFQANTTGKLSSVKVMLWVDPPKSPGNWSCGIYATTGGSGSRVPTGSALAEETGLSRNLITGTSESTATLVRVEFSDPYTVTAGNWYAVSLTTETPSDTDYYYWGADPAETPDQYHAAWNGSSWAVSGNGHTPQYQTFIESVTPQHAINEYIPFIPVAGQLRSALSWTAENTSAHTQTEDLNGQSVYYFEIFETGGYGTNTIFKITDGATNVRPIVQNNNDTWEYNSNPTFGSITWTSATTNNMIQAVRDAMTVAANKYTGADRNSSTAALLDTGFNRGVGVVLYSTSVTNNPKVNQIRINYDSNRNLMDLRSKAYDPGFVANEAYVWARTEHSDADGAGTFYVSRNGGSEWEAVSMTQQGLAFGDIRVMRGSVDLSGQVSGQDLRCRYETASAKDQFLHSWGLQVKP
jgi:hypothetical protein